MAELVSLLKAAGKVVEKAIEAAKESDVLRVAGVGSAAMESIDSGEVAPLVAVGIPMIGAALTKIPLKTEYAGNLARLDRAKESLVDRLEQLGIKPTVYRGMESIRETLSAAGLDRPVSFLVESFHQLKDFEQDCLRWADEHGVNVTAKKVEYVVGSSYEGGATTKLPLVGSILELDYKWQLKEPITPADLVRAGLDLASIIMIAATGGAAAPVAAGTIVAAEATAGVAAAGGAAAATAGTAAGAQLGAATASAAEIGAVTSTAANVGATQISAATSTAANTTEVARTAQPLSMAPVGGASEALKPTAAQRWVAGEGVDLGKGRATMGDLARNYRKGVKNIDGYVPDLYQRHPGFHSLSDRYVERLKHSQTVGPGEVQRALTQIKKNGSGELARRFNKDAVQPFCGHIAEEVPVAVGGRTTRLDLLAQNFKVPLVGKGIHVPAGGSLAMEVKAGQPGYLAGQAEHLLFQANGASIADAGITAVTSDISRLPCAVERRLRDVLRPTSPIYKLMPDKAVFDGALIRFIEQLAKGRP